MTPLIELPNISSGVQEPLHSHCAISPPTWYAKSNQYWVFRVNTSIRQYTVPSFHGNIEFYNDDSWKVCTWSCHDANHLLSYALLKQFHANKRVLTSNMLYTNSVCSLSFQISFTLNDAVWQKRKKLLLFIHSWLLESQPFCHQKGNIKLFSTTEGKEVRSEQRCMI